MSLGCEWLIDAAGCPAERLAAIEPARRVCERVIARLGLHVVLEPQWHQFASPGGVTGLYLLGESHLACHTWPETGRATFNLFCCRPRPEFPWDAEVRAALGAARVAVRALPRGVPSTEDLAAEASIDWDEMNERRYRTEPKP